MGGSRTSNDFSNGEISARAFGALLTSRNAYIVGPPGAFAFPMALAFASASLSLASAAHTVGAATPAALAAAMGTTASCWF